MISRFISTNTRLSSKAKTLRLFSEVLELPVVDLSSFIGDKTPDMKEAKKIVDGLHKYGALAIKDPRVDERGNVEFLDMMEKYFESRSKLYYSGETLTEAHPECGYQVGVTPEKVEVAKQHVDTIEEFFKEDPVSVIYFKRATLSLSDRFGYFYFLNEFKENFIFKPFFTLK